jgi:hypothetical protein
LAAFTVFGGILTGPINYVWLDVVERWSSQMAAGGGRWRLLAAKVLLQSAILQPLIYLPTFYTVTALVRGWSADEARAKVSAEYAPTLTKIWVCWTPAVLYAFGWLPKHQQSVFFAGFGFCWNVVLSLISNPQSHRDRLRVSKTERT